MVKIKIDTNLIRVQQVFSAWVEKIPDNKDAFLKFIPEFQKTREAYIYAGRNLDGQKHPALSPKYKKWKKKKYGNQPILIATGTLINAIRGHKGWRQWVGKKSMTLKIDLPYAGVHQWGYPERNLPQRNYFLTKEGTLSKIDYAQLLQAMEGEINKAMKAILGKI